jgi:hypothetical protein
MTSSYYAAKRWMKLGLRKGLVYPVCRRLYRDADRDMRHTLLVAGTGRSGTTWLAELLGSRVSSRILFEPFNPRMVRAFESFHYFHYMRPDSEDAGLENYCRAVFTGDIRHPWIDRQVDRLFPSYRIVKEIRANLLLRWLKYRFPELPIVFLIRHPCAVVASRMKLRWDTDGDILPLLSQPGLVRDFLDDKSDLIRDCRTPEQKHALIWSISNLVPLTQFAPGTLPIVFYEDLVRSPESELPRVFRLSGLEYDEATLARISRPSATTIASSAILTGSDKITRWKDELSLAQAESILAVVRGFGLSHLYGDSDVPAWTDPGRSP